MPKRIKAPKWEDIKPTTPFKLTENQKLSLAQLAGVGGENAGVMLKRVEAILNDYSFAHYIFDTYKPAHTRDVLSLKSSRKKLKKGINLITEVFLNLNWHTASDLGLIERMKWLQNLPTEWDQLLEQSREEISPRKNTTKARDIVIRDLVHVFDRFTELDPDSDEQDLIPQEYIDCQTQFVFQALTAAHIQSPSPGDAQHGESEQGKLRRLVKRWSRMSSKSPK